MTETLPLSDDFSPAGEAEWRALVDKALKGRNAATLDSQTEHGVPVRALYGERDWPSASDSAGFPASHPFVRGGQAVRDQWLPWDIRQIVRHPDPRVAREEVMEALNQGASSVELRIDGAAEQGIYIRQATDLNRLLEEVRLDLAPLAIEPVGESAGLGLESAALLAAAIDVGARKTALIAFNVDPIAALVRTGALPAEAEETFTGLGDAAGVLSEDFPLASCLRVDSRPVHEAGGTEVQEIAFLAASGAAYMRALISAGFSASAASRTMLFTVAVGSDYHVEVAKLRAVRRVWGRIGEAFGADGAMNLQAVTSRRMLARRDAWTNLLRNTAACFAAGVGGADIVTVRNFTDAMGNPGSLARRLARNTQIIAQEESGLGKVADAPGGAWAFERLSEDIAIGAWDLFQEIEAEGGVIASLQSAKFQAGVGDARRARRSAVAKRKEWITGVNDFPLLAEEVPDCLLVDSARILADLPHGGAAEIADRSISGLRIAAANGASLDALNGPARDGVECDPLWPIRLAEPYEALRELADRRREIGKPPRILLVALGPQAEHSARLSFATNFFAAGGIEAVVVASDDDSKLLDVFQAERCSLSCICGSDSRYASEAARVAGVLREGGAGRIYLAGKAGENAQQLRTAGVDEFIHVGVDVIASLELAHAELGLGSGRSQSG